MQVSCAITKFISRKEQHKISLIIEHRKIDIDKKQILKILTEFSDKIILNVSPLI